MREEKILVVEDDVISGEALRDKLQALGYRVTALATTGEEAVAAAGRSLPDIIIMDIKLGGAMDGIEAAARIQARQDVPVLYLTAYTDEETLERAKATAPYSYLVKPVRDRELHITVEMALQRHRLEKALRDQYDRLQELEKLKDNLIHMIVHDMRTPLTVLLGNLEIAKESADETAGGAATGLAASIATARRGAENLMSLIDSLLDVSRLEEGKMPLELLACDLLDLADMAAAAFLPLAKRKDISLELAGSAAAVRADPSLLRRVLDNLIGNAVKYTPAGGTITVSVTAGETDVRAEVFDSGPAIPPEYHEKIFEKFGQADLHGQHKSHSTGLGLTFCKLAVEAHGGRIGLESRTGKGNIFWFTLPVRT